MNGSGRTSIGRASLRYLLLALAGIYPFSMAYGAFGGIQPLDQYAVWRSVAVSWALTGACYWLASVVIADPDTRALTVSIVLVACSAYALICNSVRMMGVPVFSANIWVAAGYVAAVSAIVAASLRPWRPRRRDLVPMLFVTTALVGVSAYHGAAQQWRTYNTRWRTAAREIFRPPTRKPRGPRTPTASQPDIYYIVLDALGRPDILREYYDLDVSDFVEFLHERGFYVPTDVRSNYAHTLLSFSSFLNLGYLDPLANAMGVGNPSWTPFGELIRSNGLMRLAKDAGYHVTAIGSDYGPLKRFSQAEICVCSQYGMANFEQAIVGETPLGALPIDPWTYGAHRRKVLDELSALEHLPPGPSPRFIFAHVVAPHPPFIFAADGGARQPDRPFSFNEGSDFAGSRAEYVRGYRDQAAFLLTRMREVIDAILKQPGPRPVIVIHADHGPGSMLQNSAAETDLKERMSPFAAYEFPDGPDGLYASMTLVNGSRALANDYLGTSLPRLPDTSRFSPADLPFNFTTVPPEEADFPVPVRAEP